MDPTFREAGPEEAGEIVRLIAGVAAENQWIRTELPFDMEERARRIAIALAAGNMVTIFVEIDGAVVGEVTLYFREHRAALAMVIEAAYRGKGIGRMLLSLAIEKARARRATYIELAAYSHNAQALRLYRSVGFVEFGPATTEIRSNGERWEVIPMELNLTLK